VYKEAYAPCRRWIWAVDHVCRRRRSWANLYGGMLGEVRFWKWTLKTTSIYIW
jgi:hypothetical protein